MGEIQGRVPLDDTRAGPTRERVAAEHASCRLADPEKSGIFWSLVYTVVVQSMSNMSFVCPRISSLSVLCGRSALQKRLAEGQIVQAYR